MHYIEKNISHQKLHKSDNSGMTILKQLKKRKEKNKTKLRILFPTKIPFKRKK